MFVRIPDELDHCPECGHVGLELDQQELDGDEFTVRCTCDECGYTFVDVYRYQRSHEL